MPPRRTQALIWLENVRVGAEALRVHPLRTVLSVVGILIGSAALIATMAVSDGIMSFAREQIMRHTSVLVVSVSPRIGRYENGEWVPIHDWPVFTTDDAAALREHVPGVDATLLGLSGSAEIRYRGVRRQASVALGTAELGDFMTMELSAGRFFTEADVAHNASVVVVNYGFAHEVMQGRNPLSLVDQDVRINGRTRRVIGVQAPSGFEDLDDPSLVVYAPIRSAHVLLPMPRSGKYATTIQLRAEGVESVDAVRDATEDWLSRHYPRWQERIRVDLARENLEQVEKAFLLMKLFIGALVGISLLVGGIGIMNVLLAAVVERTREIGIRKSVGATAADIHTQFLAESVAIALVGSLCGLVIGFLMAVLVTAVFSQLIGVPIQAVLSPASVLIATISSSVVGLVFGTYPARRAAKLSPIVALAHE